MSEMSLRDAKLADVPAIIEVERAAWGEAAATTEMFVSRIETFPEGVLVAEKDSKVIGVVVAELLNYDLEKPIPTWGEATDWGSIRKSHVPNGTAGYGVDLASVGIAGVGTSLMLAILDRIVIKRDLAFGVLGSRMPGYHKVKDRWTPREYAFLRRIRGDLVVGDPSAGALPGGAFDAELSFYEGLGFRPLKILPEYFEDPDSCNNGVLMIWENPERKAR